MRVRDRWSGHTNKVLRHDGMVTKSPYLKFFDVAHFLPFSAFGFGLGRGGLATRMQGSLGNVAALELALEATTRIQESGRQGPLHLVVFFRSQGFFSFLSFWFSGGGGAVRENMEIRRR